jgi:hypothetical protein
MNTDYNASVSDVYIDFARNWALDYGLDALFYSGGREPGLDDFGLPSWVPESHALSPEVSWRPLATAGICSHRGLDILCAGQSILSNEKSLRAPGCSCDAVTKIESIPPQQLNESRVLDEFMHDFSRTRAEIGNPYPTGIPALQAYFRVLLADSHPDRPFEHLSTDRDSQFWYLTLLYLLRPSDVPGRIWQSWAEELGMSPASTVGAILTSLLPNTTISLNGQPPILITLRFAALPSP